MLGKKKRRGWFLKTLFAMFISGFFYRTARRFMKYAQKQEIPPDLGKKSKRSRN